MNLQRKAPPSPLTSLRAAAAWGAVLWAALWAAQHPPLTHDGWARLLLQLAVLVWAPLALSFTYPAADPIRRLVFPAGVCAVLALLLPTGWAAAGLALPWLALNGWLMVQGLEALAQAGRDTGRRALAAAGILLPVGGFSLVLDRAALQPLGFSPDIILLTAVHFHYAGFIWLSLLGLAARLKATPLLRAAIGLSLLAIPLTAAGITLGQAGYSMLPETTAATVTAFAGMLGGIGYGQLAWQKDLPAISRICWLALSAGLVFSMTLGLGYALRSYYPFDGLNIPMMRAVHGTVNAFGVAGLGLLGWYFQRSKADKNNL